MKQFFITLGQDLVLFFKWLSYEYMVADNKTTLYNQLSKLEVELEKAKVIMKDAGTRYKFYAQQLFEIVESDEKPDFNEAEQLMGMKHSYSLQLKKASDEVEMYENAIDDVKNMLQDLANPYFQLA